MKVSELIEELQKLNPDLDVVLSASEEVADANRVTQDNTKNGLPYTRSGYHSQLLETAVYENRELEYVLIGG